ncbi:het and ankyrin domain protein [Colletotrichum kahawae]|uniref:Het and ankyrin domain protein n=1 Tax=Colletotrichum kahawae TaxID=34407 RepID=A0AAE0D340_COLKA|nr:het and ankyrin domain protein [Colletotrichum kahawae]
MRLLHCLQQKIYHFTYPPSVQYAIFSHTWSSPHDDEWLSYTPAGQRSHSTKQDIIRRVCNLALSHNLQYVWIDEACIDKSSSADVSETINSLPKYFQRATICFAFLVDLPCGTAVPCRDTWARCQFWTRAWTLQELILPSNLQFYDAQWHLRGERSSEHLHSLISGITGIDEDILNHERTLDQASVARKMSWAACRRSFSPEDLAYSLLGLFGVCMPIVFGEGEERAFRRLQEEIVKHTNDSSLFAWASRDNHSCRGLFANTPAEFVPLARQDGFRLPLIFQGFVSLTSKGVLVSGQFANLQAGLWLDLGIQTREKDHTVRHGILLRQNHDGTFVRVAPASIQRLPATERSLAMQVMVFYGEFNKNDSHGHELLSSAFEDIDLCVDSSYMAPSPFDPNRPSTPRKDTAADEESLVEITPTNSNPQLPTTEADWVNVNEPSCEILESDDSEDDSMKMSQQTDAGWRRPESAMSNTTGVTSPSITESGFSLEDRLHAGDDFNGRQKSSSAMQTVWHYEQPDAYDLSVGEFSSIILDQFAASQRLASRWRVQRINRFRVSKRQSSKEPKRRSLSSLKLPPPTLACPCYVFDPMSHIDCIATHDFKDMIEVKDHLWKSHKLPYFCPTCKEVFEFSYQNDEHINQRSCELRHCEPFEGVSEDQYQAISNIPDTHDVQTEWFEVWDILFPNVPPPDDSYLRDRRDRNISSFKTFWQTRGLELLRHCLRERHPSNVVLDEQDFKNLSSDVLFEALAALVEGSVQSSDIRSTVTSSTHTMWAEGEI